MNRARSEDFRLAKETGRKMPKETELTALQSKDPLSSSTTTNPLVKTEEKVEAEQIPEGLWYKEHALGHCKVNLKPKYIKIDEDFNRAVGLHQGFSSLPFLVSFPVHFPV